MRILDTILNVFREPHGCAQATKLYYIISLVLYTNNTSLPLIHQCFETLIMIIVISFYSKHLEQDENEWTNDVWRGIVKEAKFPSMKITQLLVLNHWLINKNIRKKKW